MNCLLDSHVFLWALNDSQKLGPNTTALLIAQENQLYISTASVWELGLKHLKGKLPYSIDELLEGIEVLGLELIAIEKQDIQTFQNIRLIHDDPFDRLLVAQSQARKMAFVTVDKNILASGYQTLDAGK